MENKIISYIIENKEKYYRLAYSYVKNQEDALDIIQDAIVKALRYQHTLKDTLYVHTWFCKIVINTCKTYLQKKNRYIDLEDEALAYYEESTYDTHTLLELEEALDHLSYNEKTIILLRYYNGLELKEIAHIMEKNLSTIKSTLYRALKKLKPLLENDERGEAHGQV